MRTDTAEVITETDNANKYKSVYIDPNVSTGLYFDPSFYGAYQANSSNARYTGFNGLPVSDNNDISITSYSTLDDNSGNGSVPYFGILSGTANTSGTVTFSVTTEVYDETNGEWVTGDPIEWIIDVTVNDAQ